MENFYSPYFCTKWGFLRTCTKRFLTSTYHNMYSFMACSFSGPVVGAPGLKLVPSMWVRFPKPPEVFLGFSGGPIYTFYRESSCTENQRYTTRETLIQDECLVHSPSEIAISSIIYNKPLRVPVKMFKEFYCLVILCTWKSLYICQYRNSP